MLILNPGQVAQLRTLGESLSDAECQALLAPILAAEYEPLPGRSWRTFPARTVVAELLWQAQQFNESVAVLLRQGSGGLSNDLGREIVARWQIWAYNQSVLALHHRRADTARTYLNVILKVAGSALDTGAERSLLELIDFAQAAASPPPPLISPAGRPSVISMCVWGDSFISRAEQTFLPGILAPGNVPRLAEFGTTYIRVSTRAEDIDRVRDLSVIRELSRHAQIEYVVIPERLLTGTHRTGGRPAWTRMLFGALTYADVMFARQMGADIMFAGADVLPAAQSVSAAKRLLASGYEAVVVQPIRASAQRIIPLLESAGYRHGSTFDVPAQALYRASCETMHAFVLNSFMRTPPQRIPMDPIQFYFPTPHGFALRSFQLNTFAASTRRLPADLQYDFHTFDARFLSDLLIGLDRSQACYIERSMPGEVYFVSLDDESGVTSFGEFEMSPAGAVESIVKWVNREEDLEHFAWAVQQRFHYGVPEGIDLPLPSDCVPEEEAVKEIVGRLERARPDVLSKLEAFRA